MKNFFLIDAGAFADALEDWMIDNKCNPSTPEEWDRCIGDMIKEGKLNYIGSVEDGDTESVKRSLKQAFNIKELKDLKDNDNENS